MFPPILPKAVARETVSAPDLDADPTPAPTNVASLPTAREFAETTRLPLFRISLNPSPPEIPVASDSAFAVRSAVLAPAKTKLTERAVEPVSLKTDRDPALRMISF